MPLPKTSYYVLVIVISCLLIVLPQINITDYVRSTITSKFIIFAFSCFFIIGCFVVTFVFTKHKTIQISKLDVALFLLFGYTLINRYLIQSTYGFSLLFLELLGLALLYVVLRGLSIKTYIWFLFAIVISGVIQAVYGNLQLLGYYPSNHSGFKLTGSFFNSGPYSGFLVVVYAIALGVYLFKTQVLIHIKKQKKDDSRVLLVIVFKYFLLIGIVSIVLMIFLTYSRSAWLAAIISTVFLVESRYLFIAKMLNRISLIKKIVLFTTVVVFIGSGLLGIYHLKKGSSDGRLFIWKITSEIIKDFPITGVGFDRFNAYYMNYQANYFNTHGETDEAMVADNSYYAFNDWLQYIAENGFIGLLLLVLLILFLFKIKVVAKNTHLFLIAKGVFLTIGVFALFSYPMQILPIKFVLIIIFSLLAHIDINKYSIFDFNKNTKKWYSLWSLKTVVLVAGFVTLTNGITYIESLDIGLKTWKKAANIYQYGDYKSAIEVYAKAYPTLKKDGDFLMNYGKALSIAKQNKEAIQILEEAKHYLNTTIIETTLGDAYKETKHYKKAEIAYQHAANMIPVRFYPLYLKAKLYEDSGNKEKAIVIANIILKKEVKIPSTAIKEIKAEMRRIISETSILPKH